MMEEPANLDATLYKLFLKLDGHSAVFQIKQLYKTRRLCHSEPEKSEEHLMKVEKERRVLSRQLHTDLRKKTIEQLLQQLMDFMLLSEMPKIFEFLPFLNQHLSS